jgi:integrase
MNDKRVNVWVQKFKDRGALMLQWLDPDTGRRKSKSAGTDDEKQAEIARADLESDLNHGRHKETSRMTWEHFREAFEAEFVAAKRPNTQTNYADTLDLFEKTCNPRNLRGITQRTVSQFAAALRKLPGRRKGSVGMMESSIKVRLQFLHTALSWAVGQKMLAEVPAFPEVKVPKKDPQPVATESFERMLLKAKDDQTKAFLLCGWLAGLRLAESLALECEPTNRAPYVDFGRDRIVLPAEFVKGVRDQWVPLDPELKAALAALPRIGAKVFRFTNSRGEPLTLNGVSQRMQDLARKARVKLTYKSLRRGFGCRYAAKVSAHVLQKLMRHASIKTTLDYYANIDDAVEAAVLGSQRNTSRNSRPAEASEPFAENGATPSRVMVNSPSAN